MPDKEYNRHELVAFNPCSFFEDRIKTVESGDMDAHPKEYAEEMKKHIRRTVIWKN